MKKYDLSIHFTLKGQTVEQVDEKFSKWLDSDNYQGQFDFSENDEEEPRNVLHHCFLPKEKVFARKIGTEVWDFLDTISEHIICWNGVWNDGDSIYWDRRLMLENLKKLDGVAIFLGEIKEGVEEEYKIAQELGIECILIP